MTEKKIAALGVAFVLVFFIGMFVGNDVTTSQFNEMNRAKVSLGTATSSEPSTAPAPVVTTPTPVVAVEKKWVVTNTWSGNGAKDTENFAVTENTRINWETTSAQGIFQIYVQDKDGTPSAVAANMQGIGKDVSYLHITPGQYSLKVNAANTPWKITIEQQQ